MSYFVPETFAVILCSFAWAFAFVGCPAQLPPEPPYVIVPPDAPEDAGSGNICRLACESLAKLGCPESAKGALTCTEVCELAARTRNPLDTICVANASSVEEMRSRCHVRCMR